MVNFIEPNNQMIFSKGHFDTAGNFVNDNIDLTSFVNKSDITGRENAIDILNIYVANDVMYNPAPIIQLGDGIQVRRLSDDKLLFQGMMVDEGIEITASKGSFNNLQFWAYPALGLARMRVNETYNLQTLREVLVSPSAPLQDLFPYKDEFTNLSIGLIWDTSHTNGDWFAHRNNGENSTTDTISSVSSYSSFTSPTDESSFILINFSGSNSDNNFEFPNYGGIGTYTDSLMIPLDIDDWATALQYNPFTDLWTGIPYLDFWIFRTSEDSGHISYDVEIQLKISDIDYTRFLLTSIIDLIPIDGNWHHLQIPLGSKWGAGNVYLDGNSEVSGVPIISRCGWTIQQVSYPLDFVKPVSYFQSWNGITAINFYVSSGGTPISHIGIAGLRTVLLNTSSTSPVELSEFGGLANPYGLIETDVKELLHFTQSKYSTLNTDYIYDDPITELIYLNFVYEPAIKSLMDTINLYNATVYPTVGLHWIVTPDGNLCIAPIGNHGVSGVDSLHNVNNVWGTSTQYTPSNPIVLGKDIISQVMKRKESRYNMVLINSSFQTPQMNALKFIGSPTILDGWMRNDIWSYFSDVTGPDTPALFHNSGNAIVGSQSLFLDPIHHNTDEILSDYTEAIATFVLSGGNIILSASALLGDLTLGETIKLYINFMGGSGALAGTPTLSGGVITGIPVVNGGFGYQSTNSLDTVTNPNGTGVYVYSYTIIKVQITDSTGSGAKAYCIVSETGSGAITSVVVTDGGTGYTNPTVTFIPQQDTVTNEPSNNLLLYPIDLTIISSPILTFWLQEINLQTFEVRVYTSLWWSNNPSANSNIPDPYNNHLGSDDGQGDYFWKQITPIGTGDPTQGCWHKIDLALDSSGDWNITNNATWSKPILRIEFRIVGGGGVASRDGYVCIAGLNVNGEILHAAYSANYADRYGSKVGLINEILVPSSVEHLSYLDSPTNTKIDPQSLDQLDYLSIQEVIRESATPLVGTITITADYSIMAGQLVAVKSPAFIGDNNPFDIGQFNANQNPLIDSINGIMLFRILWFKHIYSVTEGALTTLQLSNDIFNGYAFDPANEQTKAIKTINPDSQSRDFLRLKILGIDTKSPLSKAINIDYL